MAITIHTNPTSLSSVQDNLWHVVSSDNSAQVDFKYVFDIWIGGIQRVRVKQYPDPSNSKGYFDASQTARNYMLYNWFEPLDTAYVIEPNITGEIGIAYELRVGEDFGGVTTTNLANSTNTVYNWAAPLFKRRVTGLGDKLNNWLTNRPLYANTKLGERLYIPFYTNANLILKCDKFDASNTQIGSTLTGASTIIENGFVQMNIGTGALAAHLSTTFDDSVKYYDVWFNSLDKIRVYLTCNPKYTPILIHFLNRWGMYDTQRFDLASKLTMDVERKGFGQRDYRFNGNNVDYKSSANRYYEGKVNYSNKSNWLYKLTADAMTDAEYEWIADLIDSPQILMEIDGYCYPVTLKNNNYEYSKYENNRLKALELEFEMNQTRHRQLR